MSTEKIAILDGARTPVGRYGGSLNSVPAHELGQVAAREALSRSGVSAEQVDEVVMGCVGQVGPDAYLARRVALGAGLPDSTPAFTVNRLCGSGLQAIWSGAQQLAWGGSQFILAGGAESMSRMPFLDYDARGNSRLGNRTVLDGTVAMLTDPFSGQHMGVTAENVADKYGISREQQDEFAAESQRRSGTSEALAAFAEEITEVTTGGRKPVTVSLDEHPRPDTTAESLSLLKPAFRKDGSVTAGNASGINDGASALLIASERAAVQYGLAPLARVVGMSACGVEPRIMGYGPVPAVRKVLAQTGLSLAQMDVIELNEAFAAQALAVTRALGLPDDAEQVNPNGGAIALGHPLGASGGRLAMTAAYQLRRTGGRFALCTMCVGVGQGVALILERI